MGDSYRACLTSTIVFLLPSRIGKYVNVRAKNRNQSALVDREEVTDSQQSTRAVHHQYNQHNRLH
eukprot:scaffold69367_cov90-Cyclotella_meneghiniana.AAC.10